MNGKAFIFAVICFVVAITVSINRQYKLDNFDFYKTGYDSLVLVVDSIKTENKVLRYELDSLSFDTTMTSNEFVLRYKLERIRYYNKVAGKGNNIKFLRGWLNRILNE